MYHGLRLQCNQLYVNVKFAQPTATKKAQWDRDYLREAKDRGKGWQDKSAQVRNDHPPHRFPYLWGDRQII